MSLKNGPTQNEMIQAMTGLNTSGLSFSQLDDIPAGNDDDYDANGYKKSIDERTFSDFTIDGSPKEFKQEQLARAGNAYNGDPEQRKKEDTADIIRDQAMEEMREDRERQLGEMREFNGYQFTDADLDDALDDIIEDKEGFATKHDLSEEEADVALQHAIIMKSMSPEERDEYLKDLGETHPKIAEAIAEQAQDKKIEREVEHKSTFSAEIQEQEADFFSDFEEDLENTDISMNAELETQGISDFKEESEITDTFTQEVAGVGENAKSFEPKLDVEAPDPTTEQLIENKFVV